MEVLGWLGQRRQSSSSPVMVYIGGMISVGSHLKFGWYGVDVKCLQMTMKPGNPSDDVGKIRRTKKKVTGQFSIQARPMYRLVLQKKKIPEKIHGVPLGPPLLLMDYGFLGSCTMIGEDIYWFGDNKSHDPPCSTMDLFKHDINDRCPWNWDILSSTTDLFSSGFLLVFFPFGKKLYVLLGKGINEESNHWGNRNPWGAIYDLDSNTWETLNCDISIDGVECYRAPYVALAETSKEILFYNLTEGSILFYSLTSGEWRLDQNHAPLSLWNPFLVTVPLGLDEDYCLIGTLADTTKTEPAILSNNTLYWFTSDLHLYGYDINLKRWFPSPYLGKQLPTLKTLDTKYQRRNPFLVDMRNGNILLIVPEGCGEITVAPLIVSRDGNSLSVTVESFHPLSVDTTFFPIPQMSMLKNTQAGSMHGPVISATET